MGSIGFNSQSQLQVNGSAVNWGKNYIINGGFDRWDYATSQTTSGYGSDNRWLNGNSGSTKTHSQVASTDTERALFNSPYFSRTAVTSVAGAGNLVIKSQAIENVTKLAGKTVTISFWAKADSSKNIAVDLYQGFGTGGTSSALVQGIGAQLIALTSIWQKKSITVTIPSIVGKTLGTDGVHTSSTGLRFWFDAGSDYVTQSSNLGQQSGTFDIAEVQLEDGSVDTPWAPYNGEFGGEVQACARYLPSFKASTTGSLLGMHWCNTSTAIDLILPLSTPTRVTQTGVVVSNHSHITVLGASGVWGTVSAVALTSYESNTSVSVVITLTAGGTAGQAGKVYFNNASAYIYFTGCEL